MRKSRLAAGALYLLALPGLAMVMWTSPQWFLKLPPVVLTLVCIHVGLALAPRVGFRSLIADGLHGQRPTRFGSGLVHVAMGAIVVGLIWVIPARLLIAAGLVEEAVVLPESVSIWGMLWFGGVVEELTFRWGAMSLGVFVLWKWLGRESDRPGASLYWLALILTAAVFGLAHLPHIWQLGRSATDSFGLLQIGATSVAGLIFGWVFWKDGLEFAMATHSLGNLAVWLFGHFQ